ncbi:MAG: HepT-like ribonuclease domain-containing protein [Alkalispirochaeta sp.]
MTYEEFEESKLVRFAVERQLMVIGEATAHLSEEARAAEPDIPWSLI